MAKELKEESEAVTRLAADMARMKKNEALAQKRIIEEFKSSEDYKRK